MAKQVGIRRLIGAKVAGGIGEFQPNKIVAAQTPEARQKADSSGGVGFLTRLWGLSTAKDLVGLEVADAAGHLLRADQSTNSDLFWACRGGGGASASQPSSLSSCIALTASWCWTLPGRWNMDLRCRLPGSASLRTGLMS